MKRVLLLSLCLLAAPAAFAAPPKPAPAVTRPAALTHADWTRLLGAYVRPSADGVNRFDYEALKASAADRAALDTYIASFEKADLSGTSSTAFAAWANLYNAVTVRHIVERYPLKSIRDGYLSGPWKNVKVVAGGKTVSLDEIEHAILRPTFKDPRVHYAINCASYGCPNLPTRAWEAATLEADLNAAARAYINHPRGVTVTSKGLVLSSIYDWFKADFGGTDAAVIDHLIKYADAPLATTLKTRPKVRKYVYDWALNGTPKKAKK